ncbi:MAG: hypothetical protein ACR2FV_13730 [Ornithinimicrobium sp.]|uniref:hypothetical protein n=1 Tax=Ornithinimicrobium sp. TaxID=1977084 RepID=UPI003D9B3206
MYAALWRVLPGPRWVRVVLLILLVAAVVVICFSTLFPELAPLIPFNDGTVGAGPQPAG